MHSRSRSACPLCRAYSSIMCWKIHRSDIGFVAPGARLDELIAKLKPLPPRSTLLVRDRSRHGRANGRRTVPRLRSGRVYLLAHDPGMLADLPDPAEPVVLEQLDGRAE